MPVLQFDWCVSGRRPRRGHTYMHAKRVLSLANVLDRLVHSAYTFKLKGESMRKHKSALTQNEQPSS